MKRLKILGILPKESHKIIKKNAKAVGLDKIPQGTYLLTKIGQKKKSSFGYPEKMVVGMGDVQLVGTEEHVWIVLLGKGEWFKTSPVLKVTELKTGFKLETENSFYKLSKTT